MATEIRVPTLGESVTEATIGKWFKKPGDAVKADEPLVELETDKVTLEVNAPSAGTLSEIVAKDGETVGVNALLGTIGEAGAGASAAPSAAPKAAKGPAPASAPASATPATGATGQASGQGYGDGGQTGGTPGGGTGGDGATEPADPSIATAAGPSAIEGKPGLAGGSTLGGAEPVESGAERRSSSEGQAPAAGARENGPAVGRLAAETGIDPSGVPGSGRDGRVTKGDMLAAAAAPRPAPAQAPAPASAPAPQAARAPFPAADGAREERVKMTKLRQTIARRLKDAQNTAAMLTTFNDVDMSAVMSLRAQYKDAFEKKHGVKLGFMGFFTKACVQALKELPGVNAEIDGAEIVYKNYYHVGIAVGTDKGLVVPVVRDADGLSIAGIEKRIGEYGRKARDGQLSIEDMQGGTFTITNGGIYGSLMSTPILNAPQSGILGMHRIEERPVARGGQVVIRPMMYLALSYDHRIVDGKEAVTFLVRVKEALEDPARLVLDL